MLPLSRFRLMYSELFKNFWVNSKYLPFFILAFLLVSVFACNSLTQEDSEDKVIARVFDSYLYSSDVTYLFPEGTNSIDSARMIEQFMESWIRKQLILDKAKFNLSNDQSYTEIENQLEDYRTSLIIYAYQKELIKQKLDTSISLNEIQNYYDENKTNFILEHDILRAKYIQLSLSAPNYQQVKQWCVSDDKEDIDSLEKYCHQFSNSFLLDDNTWILFENLKKEFPQNINISFQDLVQSDFTELNDSINRYLILVKSFKNRDEIAPLEYEISNIKNIILFKRKTDMIDKMEEQVYQNGINNNHFEIFK